MNVKNTGFLHYEVQSLNAVLERTWLTFETPKCTVRKKRHSCKCPRQLYTMLLLKLKLRSILILPSHVGQSDPSFALLSGSPTTVLQDRAHFSCLTFCVLHKKLLSANNFSIFPHQSATLSHSVSLLSLHWISIQRNAWEL